MRLIGVVSSKEGGGADSAHVEVVEGNDTFGGRAGKVRTRTFMRTMVSTLAISAGARVGAITAVVSWILAVALETVWVGRETFFSFA